MDFMDKLTESVRYTVCEEDFIVLVLKLVLEFKAIIGILSKFVGEVVIAKFLLGEAKVETILGPVPACKFVLVFGEDIGLHSLNNESDTFWYKLLALERLHKLSLIFYLRLAFWTLK